MRSELTIGLLGLTLQPVCTLSWQDICPALNWPNDGLEIRPFIQQCQQKTCSCQYGLPFDMEAFE